MHAIMAGKASARVMGSRGWPNLKKGLFVRRLTASFNYAVGWEGLSPALVDRVWAELMAMNPDDALEAMARPDNGRRWLRAWKEKRRDERLEAEEREERTGKEAEKAAQMRLSQEIIDAATREVERKIRERRQAMRDRAAEEAAKRSAPPVSIPMTGIRGLSVSQAMRRGFIPTAPGLGRKMQIPRSE
jgi:hypothetical protein